jgi:hypothetical protein
VTEGNLELVQVLASWVFTVPTFTAVIVTDERRLKGVELERSWPALSRDAAIFAVWLFGVFYACLALLVHFASTRRTLVGLALGLGWALAILLINVVGQLGVVAAAEWLQT